MKKYAKRVIPLLLSFLLLFNLFVPPKKTYAFAPLVWLGYTAATVVAEIAIEQGIKYVSKSLAKKTTDKVTKKVVDNAKDFDFTKTGGTKTKDGKIELDVSPLDKQKIAKYWKDEYTTIAEKSVNRKENYSKPKYEVDVNYTALDPYYYTGVSLEIFPNYRYTVDDGSSSYVNQALYMEWFSEVVDIKFEGVPFERKSIVTFIDSINNRVIGKTSNVNGGSPSATWGVEIKANTDSVEYVWYQNRSSTTANGWTQSYSSMTTRHDKSDDTSFDYWLNLRKQAVGYNTTFIYADGFIMPNTMKNIYNIPSDTPSNYDIGQNKPDRGITIELPVEFNDGQEYEITENNYEQFINPIETYIANQDNSMDLSTNNYDYSQTIINNYYTYEEGEKEPSEVENEIVIIIDNDDNDGGEDGGEDGENSGGDGGNLPAESNKFTELIGTVAQQMKDVYTGFTGFLTASVDGMKELAVGTVGLATFFTGWFSFMPDEFTSLLGIAFMMGVFAHFFRR